MKIENSLSFSLFGFQFYFLKALKVVTRQDFSFQNNENWKLKAENEMFIKRLRSSFIIL